jgi:hypothetical protein
MPRRHAGLGIADAPKYHDHPGRGCAWRGLLAIGNWNEQCRAGLQGIQNGKFQAVGNGGWGGTINYAAMAEALRRGYATTSTDTGHASASGSFAPWPS